MTRPRIETLLPAFGEKVPKADEGRRQHPNLPRTAIRSRRVKNVHITPANHLPFADVDLG